MAPEPRSNEGNADAPGSEQPEYSVFVTLRPGAESEAEALVRAVVAWSEARRISASVRRAPGIDLELLPLTPVVLEELRRAFPQLHLCAIPLL